jgi:hypothetical protein
MWELLMPLHVTKARAEDAAAFVEGLDTDTWS